MTSHRNHGLTRLESIISLLVCLTITWILLPVALIQLGVIKPDESTSTAVIGIAAAEKKDAAIKPEAVEPAMKFERPKPKEEALVKPQVPELPANQIPPVVSPRSN
jgi:hypothetical protein